MNKMTYNLKLTNIVNFPNISIIIPKDPFCSKCGCSLDCVGSDGALMYWCEECLSLCPQCETYPMLYLNYERGYPIPACENCDYLFTNPIDEEVKDPGYD